MTGDTNNRSTLVLLEHEKRGFFPFQHKPTKSVTGVTGFSQQAACPRVTYFVKTKEGFISADE